MRLSIAQFAVERDVEKNKTKILSILDAVNEGEWIVFPEGAVSGYFPHDDNFLIIDPQQISDAIDEICAEARQRGCTLILGSATHIGDAWRNSVVLQTSEGVRYRYDKIELSNLDQRHFEPGEYCDVYEIDGVKVGVQVCRELLFPKAWCSLTENGAQMLIHVNNAIKPIDAVWEHVVIARAVENQRYVCSVNNAANPQELASYVVSPHGEVLLMTKQRSEQVLTCEIDLTSSAPHSEF